MLIVHYSDFCDSVVVDRYVFLSLGWCFIFLTVISWRLHSCAYILFSVAMILYSFDWKKSNQCPGGSVDSLTERFMRLLHCSGIL